MRFLGVHGIDLSKDAMCHFRAALERCISKSQESHKKDDNLKSNSTLKATDGKRKKRHPNATEIPPLPIRCMCEAHIDTNNGKYPWPFVLYYGNANKLLFVC